MQVRHRQDGPDSLLDMLRWRWLYRSEAQEADLGHGSGFVGHSKADCGESQSQIPTF